ncbi:MAG: hypothetical protein HYY50_00920 [Candidatus Kerfeldbacteria bacterium]|nr:hypothetical protein [Candidatus Kerfeldbacteria bacterium]
MGYEIKLDNVLSTARVGINRAWVFMGLGVNAASIETLTPNVTGASYLKLLPDEISADSLREFKTEFRTWVVVKGLEELIEVFGVFLEQLYSMVLFVDAWKSKGQVDQKQISQFTEMGIREKLNILNRNFGIGTAFNDDIVSVNQARHCLTHRLGIVATRDLNTSSGLKVQWRTLQLYGHNEDGSEFVPDMERFEPEGLKKEPVVFPRGSPAKMRNDPRSKVFPIGSRVVLEPRDLKEICLWFSLLLNELNESVIKYCEKSGVHVTRLAGQTPGATSKS